MAKRKKRAETQRWKIGCPRCEHPCPAAIKRHAKKVDIAFECHNSGLSGEMEARGEEAKKFQ